MGCGVQGVECRVQGAGGRVQGVGCRVQGLGFELKGVDVVLDELVKGVLTHTPLDRVKQVEPLHKRESSLPSFSLLLSGLELSDTKVYEPSMRALLGTAS